MWIKLFVVLAYLLALFFVSRLLEAAAWYEAGFLPHSILDPFALSVKKLKRLLETRGLSYAGFVEKHELTSLIESSGEVTEGELAESESEENNAPTAEATQFTAGSHFYEEVEDTKDSVWLVQVIPLSGAPLLADVVWKNLQSRVAPFGVRTGVLDCSVDQRLCKRKGWQTPQLILAMPKGQRAKDNVVLHTYPFRRPVRVQLVMDWLRRHLMARVHRVKSVQEVRSEWLQYSGDDKQSEVRVLMISVLLEPPLFLLALGVKFSGRIRVGMMQVKEKEKNKELQDIGVTVTPTYLIITPERIFIYGQRIGEYLNYRRMELFMKTLRPEVNDVFVFSLVLVNLLGSLNLFIVSGPLWRHLVMCFWRLSKANFILFFLWLLLLALTTFSFMDFLYEMGLKTVRLLSGSDLAAVLRDEWHKWRGCYLILASTFAIFSCCISWLWRRWRPQDVTPVTNRSTPANPVSEWWSVSLDAYLMDCFFRPIATLTQPLIPSDLDLEEGMELLIERLAVPNLWLHPVIPTDYIKDLIVWSYCRNQDDESGKESAGESDVKSSEDEGESYDECCQCRTVDCRVNEKSKMETTDTIPNGMLICHECAICLETYKDGAVLCGLPCGHNYHQHCILLWLSRDNHHCPVCRWPSYKLKNRPKTDSHPH